ncbi:MAG: DUF192 domain-containing protein [Deltaproteobacteria bacterium]|nr:DUF192 domain-containing protein [Deltaproteobacteria bacterium]
MRGLIGKKGLKKGEALLIRPCRGVHTLGMRFPIDVLFLDSGGRVVGIRENMPPMRLSWFFLKAEAALELPAGTVSSTGTMVGDVIAIGAPSLTGGA